LATEKVKADVADYFIEAPAATINLEQVLTHVIDHVSMIGDLVAQPFPQRR
jgi:hypothetical protein